MTQLLIATRKSNYTFTEGIFLGKRKVLRKLPTLAHPYMAGYGPKDSPSQSFQQFLACVHTRLEKTINAS